MTHFVTLLPIAHTNALKPFMILFEHEEFGKAHPSEASCLGATQPSKGKIPGLSWSLDNRTFLLCGWTFITALSSVALNEPS